MIEIIVSLIVLIIVLMPILLALVPSVKKIKFVASKKIYGVTIEKYPAGRKHRRKCKPCD